MSLFIIIKMNAKKRLKNFIIFRLRKEKNIKIKNNKRKMRPSSNTIKNTMLKKKISNTNSSNNSVQLSAQSQLNKTSLSSLSSTSSLKNEDKLTQLKQKLQQERQSMRKTGRRFKQNSSEIEIQTQQSQQLKSITNKPRIKSSKKTVGVGVSTSTATNLYDFNSIKNQVENKTKKLFIKKTSTSKDDPVIIPTYTTQQILNSKGGILPLNNKKNMSIGCQTQNLSLSKQQKIVQNKNIQRKTVNLMQLSSVLQKSPTKSTLSKQKSSNKQESELKFFDPSKVKKNVNAPNQNILTNRSKIFQKAIKQQKKRNKQVHDFLQEVGLQDFTQGLVNLGFDEVQTLIQVQVDDLNQVMMRAKQQDRLMKLIKQYKFKNQIESQENKPLVDRPSSIKSRLGFRPKSAALTTQPSDNNSNVQNSRMRSTTQNFNNMSQSTLVNKSSIFYLMEGSQWSLESQIRKACSGCFKVSYDAIKRGECYYCQNCDPGQLDELEFSLNQSMVRNYH